MTGVGPPLTVAICTYNRSASLAVALSTLAAQQGVAPETFEVLIVDNNSDDDTRRVAQGFAEAMRLRVVGEPRQGAAYARNRALQEAATEWLVFADDDVRLAAGWVAAWLAALREAADAAYAGGRILPDWGDAPPSWHRGEKLALIDGALVWFDLGEEIRRLTEADPTPFSANMAVRRAFALELGGFKVELGARGGDRGRGEETDFFLRARRAGAAGLYVGSALCRHRFDPARFTLPALFRYGVESGRAHRAIVDADAHGSLARSLAFLARGGLQALKGRGDRLRQCVINAGLEAALAARAPVESD